MQLELERHAFLGPISLTPVAKFQALHCLNHESHLEQYVDNMWTIEGGQYVWDICLAIQALRPYRLDRYRLDRWDWWDRLAPGLTSTGNSWHLLTPHGTAGTAAHLAMPWSRFESWRPQQGILPYFCYCCVFHGFSWYFNMIFMLFTIDLQIWTATELQLISVDTVDICLAWLLPCVRWLRLRHVHWIQVLCTDGFHRAILPKLREIQNTLWDLKGKLVGKSMKMNENYMKYLVVPLFSTQQMFIWPLELMAWGHGKLTIHLCVASSLENRYKPPAPIVPVINASSHGSKCGAPPEMIKCCQRYHIPCKPKVCFVKIPLHPSKSIEHHYITNYH